jgi:rare lipoprotein A
MWETENMIRITAVSKTQRSTTKLKSAINMLTLRFCFLMRKIKAYLLRSDRKWRDFCRRANICAKCLSAILILLVFSPTANAQTGKASFYTMKSVRAEGNSGITASGAKFNEDSFTAAMRSRAFGKKYKVTNLTNGKSVLVTHNDYGPGKGPYAKGVIIDLSKGAFKKIADPKLGIIKVNVEEVRS